MHRSTHVLVLALFFSSAPLAADCRHVVGNIISTNCHFDSSLTGWTVESGSGTHDNATGNPSMSSPLAGAFVENGAASVTTSTNVRISRCVNTTAYGSYRYYLAYQADNGTEETCYVRASEYNTINCPAGTALETVASTDGALTGWERMSGFITVDSGVKSLELEGECAGVGAGHASAHFDDGLLKQEFVFLDNFENDGFNRWSDTAP